MALGLALAWTVAMFLWPSVQRLTDRVDAFISIDGDGSNRVVNREMGSRRYRVTITWAPNFAFGLVNARQDELAKRRWDLSALRFILNGGEAIVARTARRFLQLLAPHGLPATAMRPALTNLLPAS